MEAEDGTKPAISDHINFLNNRLNFGHDKLQVLSHSFPQGFNPNAYFCLSFCLLYHVCGITEIKPFSTLVWSSEINEFIANQCMKTEKSKVLKHLLLKHISQTFDQIQASSFKYVYQNEESLLPKLTIEKAHLAFLFFLRLLKRWKDYEISDILGFKRKLSLWTTITSYEQSFSSSFPLHASLHYQQWYSCFPSHN